MCGRLGNKIGLEVRVHAFQLYTQLFNKVMNGEFSFDLPNEWLWDLMDEFLYNFQTFCQYRQKKSVASTAQKEELEKVWHVRDVLTILETLVQVSQIEKLLTSAQQKRYVFLLFFYDYDSSSLHSRWIQHGFFFYFVFCGAIVR